MPGTASQHPHQARQLPAQEGLAAGDAELGDAEADEDPDEAGDLFKAEDGLPRQVGVVGAEHLAGHAVGAAEVAAVCDRDAEGLEGPAQDVEGCHIPQA